jgi:hypothetical protein
MQPLPPEPARAKPWWKFRMRHASGLGDIRL